MDHYSKVLHDKKVFYLLFYAILDNERLIQRTLEDIFNYSGFKTIFNLDESETVRSSSISERLSKIDSGYFKEIFEYMYDILKEVKRDTEHRNIYIINRGFQSTRAMKDFSQKNTYLLSALKKTENTKR